MNVRIPPKFYVAGEGRVWFVEGYTSDDTRDWDLSTAFRAFDGSVAMTTVKRAADLPDHEWTLTPWGGRPSDREMLIFMCLVGNMQRQLATLTPARWTAPQ